MKNIRFPKELLIPVENLLKSQLELLETRAKTIENEDPFKDPDRGLINAAMDIEAEEQFSHDMVTAMKIQINQKISQTKNAISRIKNGEYGYCEKCNKMINTDRLMIYPEATLCVSCKEKNEK